MKKKLFGCYFKSLVNGFLIFFFLCSPVDANKWVSIKNTKMDYPVFISGTRLKGVSNITEPKPKRSEYLQVLTGGIVLVETGAAFFLKVQIIKEADQSLYFKIEYPNLKDPANPLTNDMIAQPDGGTYIFTSPETIKGLAGYGDYLITISVFENEEAEKPLEILHQKVRSYVDTRQDETLIFKKVLENR